MMGHKSYRKVTKYLVCCQGFEASDDQWEPRQNLLTCGELIKAYKHSKGTKISPSDDDEPYEPMDV